MTREDFRAGFRALFILTSLCAAPAADCQDYPDIPGYVPGTPPWVPVIDQCMMAGGQRNDCIEALPPDMYADFIAAEKSRGAERASLLQLPRIRRVPPAESLPDIYKSPLSVATLPVDVAEELAAVDCLIPRSPGNDVNVVTGELAAPGQRDIAVICSADGNSQIRIFWGGPASCAPPEDTSPDWTLLYRQEDWEYIRAIAVASPAQIRAYYDRYPEECPLDTLPMLNHDGLEDIIVEKGSSILYCHDGQWLRLCGAD